MTLRQLVWAAQGRREDAWDRTAHLLCRIYNSNRGGGRALGPDDFNPLVSKRERQRPRQRISDPRLIALEDGLPFYVVK